MFYRDDVVNFMCVQTVTLGQQAILGAFGHLFAQLVRNVGHSPTNFWCAFAFSKITKWFI